MEQNKNQSNQAGSNQNNTGNNPSDMSGQKMQHRSDVVSDKNNNTENGSANPQDGEDWSNYRNRSLSGNAEQQNNK